MTRAGTATEAARMSTSEPDLTGRVALITGAANGMGAATSARLAGLGATVVGVDVNDAAGAEVFAALGAPHRYRHHDVTDADAWTALVAAVVADHGRLDIVHLNAGVMSRPTSAPAFDDPLAWFHPAAYRKVMGVNADGVAYGIMAALAVMTTGARIVVTASAAGLKPLLIDPTYAASKYALVGLVRSLAPTLAARGIGIDAICPGGVDTAIVPEDLRRQRGDAFAPPSYIADAVVTVLGHGLPGGIWLAYGVATGVVRQPD